MLIDWNETLAGAENAGMEATTRASARAIASLRLGRLAGIGAATLLIAGAFLAITGALSTTLPFLMAASGLLLANVLGFVALDRLGNRGVIAASIAALSGLIPAATLSLTATAGMIGILACEWLWQREATRGRTDWMIGAVVAAFGAAALAIVATQAAILPAALVIAALIPIMVAALRFGQIAAQANTERKAEDHINRAFIEFALQRLPKRQVMVDAAGRIEPNGAHASFQRHLATEVQESENLVDRVLIADRPKVLQALSNAIHKNAPAATLVARMRDAEAASPLAAPVYIAQRLVIGAAPGVAERAIVLIEEAERRRRGDGEITTDEGPAGTIIEALSKPSPDTELLARALHDSVSPFNAGLGYLEMIADPRLAPQDVSAYRSYAREAMSAIREAHRNASLMGRWLKLDATPQSARRERVTFGEIAGDAIRAMHLGGDGTTLEIRIDPAASALALTTQSDRARFALAIYLRGVIAQAGKIGRVTFHARFEAADLRVVTRIEPLPPTRKGGDMFQLALERVALKSGDMRFETGSDGTLSLVLADCLAPSDALSKPALSAFSRKAS